MEVHKRLQKLLKLDLATVHTKEELEAALGKNYITDTAAEYGLGMNGRALAIAEDIYDRKPAEAFLDNISCRKILRPQHCHIDLYGNAVPSGCPGLAAEAGDYLREEVPVEKYPVMTLSMYFSSTSLEAREMAPPSTAVLSEPSTYITTVFSSMT